MAIRMVSLCRTLRLLRQTHQLQDHQVRAERELQRLAVRARLVGEVAPLSLVGGQGLAQLALGGDELEQRQPPEQQTPGQRQWHGQLLHRHRTKTRTRTRMMIRVG